MLSRSELDQLYGAFDALGRVGWATRPSPITSLSPLARELGLDALTIKRDDLLDGLYGGSKVRKLDLLAAQPALAQAAAWTSAGAIGSGHLVAASAAARALGKRFTAHCFWEPPDPHVLENLACTAQASTALRYYRSRLHLALRRPGVLLLSPRDQGVRDDSAAAEVTIPPGATCPAAIAGVVRGGVELALQIAAFELPPPTCVYLALGSGGLAAGVALGLGMAGVTTEVRAVAVVERPLSTRGRLDRLVARTRAWLAARGLAAAANAAPAPIRILRGHLGLGYGQPTPASARACARLASFAINLEPIYTGKAMAALVAAATTDSASVADRPASVLFWHSAHRFPLGMPSADWWARLPLPLKTRVAPLLTAL